MPVLKRADTRAVQAAGSWSVDACCKTPGNECKRAGDEKDGKPQWCGMRGGHDSNWLFGLFSPDSPDPPKQFIPTFDGKVYQQFVHPEKWPEWGTNGDLSIGRTNGAPASGSSDGFCDQGSAYIGWHNEICGGKWNWGRTEVEVWELAGYR